MPAEQVFWRRVVSYNEWALNLPDPFYKSKIIIASSNISIIGCKELLEDFNFKYRMTLPELIYNPITAMGFSAMFTFQLDNTKI